MKRNTRLLLVRNFEPVEYQTHSFIHLYVVVLIKLNNNRLLKEDPVQIVIQSVSYVASLSVR
jgi:hypothetical protein